MHCRAGHSGGMASTPCGLSRGWVWLVRLHVPGQWRHCLLQPEKRNRTGAPVLAEFGCIDGPTPGHILSAKHILLRQSEAFPASWVSNDGKPRTCLDPDNMLGASVMWLCTQASCAWTSIQSSRTCWQLAAETALSASTTYAPRCSSPGCLLHAATSSANCMHAQQLLSESRHELLCSGTISESWRQLTSLPSGNLALSPLFVSRSHRSHWRAAAIAARGMQIPCGTLLGGQQTCK
jgi:hypothetical protein